MIRNILAAVAAATVLAVPAAASATETQPDATIELSAGTVAVGVGYTWGGGTLHYKGHSIPVKLHGLSVASVGGGSIRASGEVYYLNKLEDFDGNYTSVSAGATVAGGASASAMRNQHGVVIKLTSSNQGLQFNLSVEGVAIKAASN